MKTKIKLNKCKQNEMKIKWNETKAKWKCYQNTYFCFSFPSDVFPFKSEGLDFLAPLQLKPTVLLQIIGRLKCKKKFFWMKNK